MKTKRPRRAKSIREAIAGKTPAEQLAILRRRREKRADAPAAAA